MESGTHDRPDLVRRSTRRYRRNGQVRTYQSILVAGRKLDRRTLEAKLFKQVEDQLHQELGGLKALSMAQVALCRRAAVLWLQAELAERALLEGGEFDGAAHRAISAELRRCLESLGLSKTPQPGSPPSGAGYGAALTAAAEGDRKC